MNRSRRQCLRMITAAPVLSQLTHGRGAASWRDHFAALTQTVNGRPLAYLDSAATTLRPETVIDAVASFYRRDNANPGHSGARHTLAMRAAEEFDGARRQVASFVNARDADEIVWVRGTTEAINLVAASWGSANLKAGDEVIVTVTEHYSNLVPWQIATQRAGARLRFIDVDDSGELRIDQLDAMLSARTKLVAFSHVSNVLGIVNPVEEICRRARTVGARVLVDGAQSAPHLAVDVQALGCDFFAFSSHKMLGPMGVGVLWGRRELLDAMPPYQSGANMAHDVEREMAHYAAAAHKFGAGTPNVADAVGLAAAIGFADRLGRESCRGHEQRLTRHALERLAAVPGLRILGTVAAARRIPLFSFTIDGVAVPDIVTGLDQEGIAVRGGDLAALPLLTRMGVSSAARASLHIYNTADEIDRLARSLEALSRRGR